jgi:hypothetical protein
MTIMRDTAVQNENCANCGVEVREGADFCYNCGKAVSAEAVRQTAEHAVEEIHRSIGSAAMPAMDIPSKDSAPEPKRKLQSAAALRRKSKSYIAKPVEVEWVEPDSSPKAFVATTIVLTVLALLLLITALYLR